ncbi:Oligoketide cyclase/lipid transport protein [uncultured Alphaproteobacteria bacterium]|uniref:Oligoketide cyclase/lipid transport protein n=1 Tax=uncultured Alphaproteobacteria bacterium TaxID=91750 RepID=A0A212J7H8_9PROT|nr:Oligoketide cyclase/lipid transport protein [uncultured Alphaproteobacteria bacterium]
MKSYTESRFLPYTPEQMFDLVADVPSYPKFLPWCLATRVVGREGENVFLSEMDIGFKMMRERYTSRVTLKPSEEIDVEALEGIFKELHTIWRFAPAPGGTRIGFEIRFAFRSFLLQTMIGAVFNEAARMMVRSFEKRAQVLYG